MHNYKSGGYIFAIVLGAVFVVWLGLLMAPAYDEGIFSMLLSLNVLSTAKGWFQITFCKDSLHVALVMLGMYALVILILWASRGNFRYGEEHGSARWANVRKLAKTYREPKDHSNEKILTQHFSISLNMAKHYRNLLTFVVGGPGSGKTRYYAKPNILQANTSYVILDPKGELLRDTGQLLKDKGYTLRVLDLKEMWKSNGYNPLAYIRDDNDVQRLATNLIKATTPKNSASTERFWEDKAEELLVAIIFLLYYSFPIEQMNFPKVMELLQMAAIEDEKNPKSELDKIIEAVQETDPNHPAIKYFNSYHLGAVKTKQSIQSTLSAHLTKFNLPSLINLTSKDELQLDRLGEEKTALYCVIPHNDTSFNFIVSILYMQLFQILMNNADAKHDGVCPVPVHFIMDEFANVAIPNDFRSYLSTMRSYMIFVSIIVQNLTDIKTLFKDEWESVIGDCDTFLYLGGNEETTFEYLEKRLGKETIDTASHGVTRGRNGSSSRNRQTAGRELKQSSEIGKLNYDKCILLVKGEDPVIDDKFKLKTHPNYEISGDGKKGKKYRHGDAERALGSISFASMKKSDEDDIEYVDIDADAQKKEIREVNPDELNQFIGGLFNAA